MSSTSGVKEVPRASRRWYRIFVTNELCLLVCLTALLSLLICPFLFVSDPSQRATLFQAIAAAFFTLVLLRSIFPFKEAEHNKWRSSGSEQNSIAGLLIAFAGSILAYVVTVFFYFICDDFDQLEGVRHPFMTGLWPQFTKGQFDGVVYIFYRPVGYTSLFLDYRLWHNWAPGYHVTNILLHLLCIAGLFVLCKQLEFSTQTCTAAALIFAVLPVNVQTVTWMSCRFDLLATGLGVWSLAFAARFRKNGYFSSYAMAILLFVLAVFSKESAYVIPVLWLELEVLPWQQQSLRPPFTRRSEPLLGYVAAPLLLLFHRLHVLGGIAGYHSARDGSPIAESVGIKSAIGVLVRAPAETLFGYNWLRPSGHLLPLLAGIMAAIFLILVLFARINADTRRIFVFCLIWVLLCAAPAHFYFLTLDPGGFYSRALYFGSAGTAILLAVLIAQAFTSPNLRLGCTAVIAFLLFIGVQHNISAWRASSNESRRIQTRLSQFEPHPPLRRIYFIKGVPEMIQGVPFFTVGLDSAVRFHYSWRDDIYVRTSKSLMVEPRAVTLDLSPTQ
jgi:hypothetical protein